MSGPLIWGIYKGAEGRVGNLPFPIWPPCFRKTWA